jgi:hypothetical protein
MTVKRTPALDLALNSALSERQAVMSRQSLLMGGIDNKRPDAWCSYGYKTDLCFNDYYRLFERGGIAHGAVMTLNENCWSTDPEVIEGDEEDRAEAPTAWEKQFKKLAKRLKLWEKFRDADMRRLVGRYSCILLQFKDSKQWDKPVGKASEQQLINLIPAWEAQIRVSAWYDNPADANFGKPKEFIYTENALNDNFDAEPGRIITVHPDRVVVIGDMRNGIPFLQAGFNDCVNMEKVLGGSGESFLKNASRQLAINFDKEVDLSAIARAHGVAEGELQEIFDEVTRGMNRGQDQTVITKGATVTPLVANVPDPIPAFDVSLQSFCASIRIPSKIIVGNQTGERASTEDQKTFNKRCQGRRVSLLSSDIETFVDHLMRLGVLLTVESSVCWDDLSEASQAEMLANVVLMADVNQKMLASGELVFSIKRMIEASGYDYDAEELTPLPDVEPAPEDPATVQ